MRDWTDAHLDRWLPVLPQLDPDVEATVTRAGKLTQHLKKVKEQTLADLGLQRHEFDTLHALAGRGGSAAPSELAGDLGMAPASVTGRLDALESRGYVRRQASVSDRRRIDVHLTDDGRAVWLDSMDRLGHEETRVLGVLEPEERRALSDLLRRIMVEAERKP